MKNYSVSIDITYAITIHVDAESEDQAYAIALEKVRKEPYYYATKIDAYVGSDVVTVDEDD